MVSNSKAMSFLVFLTFFSIFSLAKSTTTLEPQALDSFNVSYIQNLGLCSYTVIITTSCSSPRYTRDQISLAFGDAYGNQIYVPRLDNPSSRAFEACSSDTFQIRGPCAYQICYVYLYRSGPDGWMPGTVKIYSYNSRAVTFNYNKFIPSDIWYGFNYCNAASSSSQRKQIARTWLVFLVLGFMLCALL